MSEAACLPRVAERQYLMPALPRLQWESRVIRCIQDETAFASLHTASFHCANKCSISEYFQLFVYRPLLFPRVLAIKYATLCFRPPAPSSLHLLHFPTQFRIDNVNHLIRKFRRDFPCNLSSLMHASDVLIFIYKFAYLMFTITYIQCNERLIYLTQHLIL